jgi:CRP/FNR family cyclic AMP-dependent transcriptional regulator
MQVTDQMLAQFLAKTEIFEGFESEEVELFVPHLEITKVAASHTIFQEGTIGDAWFVVLNGEVSVTKEMASGPPHVLSHLYPGDSFGEMALMDGAPRMATLYTVEDSIFARLPRDVFMQLLREGRMPAIKLLWAMASVLCQRQRELTHILSDLVEGPEDEMVREYEVLSQLLRTNVTWN